ncbi:pantoate--beta-alanine ligase [Desulfurivibrio alkaliphilus]|uniref:Pantothenate synthetase n=1 Tax=Desulfurivibrio alkaliphilus (strain DSM 19089 / UNIQEM U267 / AHT2) TaxID=589865 RepID=D6Z1H0_DESAT|nr:pantoate--beta-alanine ligase [Desulfurivibrio alkaliphilus]ADH85425.1 pantoate/beta-alanine ligase [Desulfurivibrio alkaliphilus AHT 2]
MEIITQLEAMRGWAERRRREGGRIALVPTMGYFHEGHLHLMRLAATQARHVVVSLFVNPIQFAPGEDLADYPRDRQRDADLAADCGVEVLFCPEPEAMYPPTFRTSVTVTGLSSEVLCGRSRPTHFTGVATVLTKLFNLIRPHKAIFGEKDFQQLAVIRALVRDLNWDLEVVGHPIVREADGLAMSSRNVYMTKEQRQAALALPRALEEARRMVAAGETNPEGLRRQLAAGLEQAGLKWEYIEFVDPDSLAAAESITPGTVLALAARSGKTRLIDNCRL